MAGDFHRGNVKRMWFLKWKEAKSKGRKVNYSGQVDLGVGKQKTVLKVGGTKSSLKGTNTLKGGRDNDDAKSGNHITDARGCDPGFFTRERIRGHEKPKYPTRQVGFDAQRKRHTCLHTKGQVRGS